jgi:hypothetical protein
LPSRQDRAVEEVLWGEHDKFMHTTRPDGDQKLTLATAMSRQMLHPRRRQPPRKLRKIPRSASSPPYNPPPLRPHPTDLPSLDRYIQLLKQNKEKGYRGRQQNYEPHEIEAALNHPENVAKYRVQTDYPIVQEAKGAKGSDKRKGNTIGVGPGGMGGF